MAVEREHVETLMAWLAEGGSVRSALTGADTLVEKLAAVVFQGERDWPGNADQVDAYRDGLRAWFADDSGSEQQFTDLTSADTDPGVFVDWFLPVVLEWEGRAARSSTAGAEEDEEATGWPNPNPDGTPGTEFYRLDETTQEYLYSASADGPDWATYEQRRYAEPARNDDYGLDCRYDRTGGVYEWYDEAAGTWNDQAWADRYVADRRAAGAETSADDPAPAWDDDWAMFYRTRPDGGYEFADAVVPGDRGSGCGQEWISHRQAHARNAGDPAAGVSGGLDALESAVEAAVAAVIAEVEGADALRPEELAGIRAEIIAELDEV